MEAHWFCHVEVKESYIMVTVETLRMYSSCPKWLSDAKVLIKSKMQICPSVFSLSFTSSLSVHRRNCILADEMGLGKTVVVAAAGSCGTRLLVSHEDSPARSWSLRARVWIPARAGKELPKQTGNKWLETKDATGCYRPKTDQSYISFIISIYVWISWSSKWLR